MGVKAILPSLNHIIHTTSFPSVRSRMYGL